LDASAPDADPTVTPVAFSSDRFLLLIRLFLSPPVSPSLSPAVSVGLLTFCRHSMKSRPVCQLDFIASSATTTSVTSRWRSSAEISHSPTLAQWPSPTSSGSAADKLTYCAFFDKSTDFSTEVEQCYKQIWMRSHRPTAPWRPWRPFSIFGRTCLSGVATYRTAIFRSPLPCRTTDRQTHTEVGWWRGTVVERRSLAGELSLSCA